MPNVTFTLIDDKHGNVLVRTDMDAPRAGAALSPAQQLALDTLGHYKHARLEITYGPQAVPLVALARDLLNPEQYGFAVTGEIRNAARAALGQQVVPAECNLPAALPSVRLLAAANRALRVFKAQGESARKGNVLEALETAIAEVTATAGARA